MQIRRTGGLRLLAERSEAMFATRRNLRSKDQRVAKSSLWLSAARSHKRSAPLPRGRAGRWFLLLGVVLPHPLGKGAVFSELKTRAAAGRGLGFASGALYW